MHIFIIKNNIRDVNGDDDKDVIKNNTKDSVPDYVIDVIKDDIKLSSRIILKIPYLIMS